MTRRNVRKEVRRSEPLRWGSCALPALALLSLLLCGTANAQSLRLRSASASKTDSVRVAASNESNDSASPRDLSAAADSSSPTEADTDSAKTTPGPAIPPQVARDRSSADSSAAGNAPRAEAAPAPSDDLAAALERRGDLNLHGLSLNAALFTISEQWNINIVAGDVQGTVNGVFKQAPLREILDSILLSNGYNYRAIGKSLVVSSVAELGQVNPFFRSATIPVASADIDEVVEGAKLLSTPQGQVRPMKSAHSIVVLDFPDRVKMIREFVAAIDGASSGGFAAPGSRSGRPLEVGYFRTQYIAAKTAEQALQPVLSHDGKIGVMEREDRLLITDYAENLAMIEKVLVQIDHPRPQVRITALIYDISLQDVERLGINWGSGAGPTTLGSSAQVDSDGNRTRSTALDVDSIMQVPFQAGAAGSTLTFLNLSKHIDIRAVVLALQQANDARLLADPNVVVMENEEAIFQSVSEIPFQQLTQTSQGGQIGTTSFKDAGITLKVRPKIASDDTLAMEVAPEFSRLTGFTPGDNQPIIDRRTASTVLRVANKQTVVIGGLRQRSDIGDFKGVPYLKDMRLVGRLFRSRDTNVRESELVVFIMPEIVGYGDKPNCRQQFVADTIDCRLNQIPEAEGCPPCCRRLPGEGGMCGPMQGPSIEPNMDMQQPEGQMVPSETLPVPPQPEELPPLSADQIPSSEFQFGAAGRAEHVRAMVADGRMRRLPAVERDGAVVTASATATSPAPSSPGLFQPPATAQSQSRPGYEGRVPTTVGVYPNQQRTAEREKTPSVSR